MIPRRAIASTKCRSRRHEPVRKINHPLAAEEAAKGVDADSWDFMRSLLNNCKGKRRVHSGFTLIELLVVIAIIAILAAILLPVLQQAQQRAKAIYCVNNMKELQTGSILYAGDNTDKLPGNAGQPGHMVGSIAVSSGIIGEGANDGDWVAGSFRTLDNSSSAPDTPAGCSTNALVLGVGPSVDPSTGLTINGSIGPYMKNAAAYLCPADVLGIDPVSHSHRVRSCSENCFAGGTLFQQSYSSSWLGGGLFAIFRKYSDFRAGLSASDCFTFLDENPESLNDGFLLLTESGTTSGVSPSNNSINDRPAANHGNATAFAYADGHAALHQWHDSFLTITGGAGSDSAWLNAHATYYNYK